MSNTTTKFQSLEALSIRDLLSDCLSRSSFLIFCKSFWRQSKLNSHTKAFYRMCSYVFSLSCHLPLRKNPSETRIKSTKQNDCRTWKRVRVVPLSSPICKSFFLSNQIIIVVYFLYCAITLVTITSQRSHEQPFPIVSINQGMNEMLLAPK